MLLTHRINSILEDDQEPQWQAARDNPAPLPACPPAGTGVDDSRADAHMMALTPGCVKDSYE